MCSICTAMKPVASFDKQHRAAWNGIQPICKACFSEYTGGVLEYPAHPRCAVHHQSLTDGLT